MASDKEEAIDTIDAIQDDVDELEQQCSTGSCTPSDADPIREKMRAIDRQLIQVDAGGAALVGVPLSDFQFAVTSEASAHLGSRFELDEDDIRTLGNLDQIAVGGASQDQLESEVAASRWTSVCTGSIETSDSASPSKVSTFTFLLPSTAPIPVRPNARVSLVITHA